MVSEVTDEVGQATAVYPLPVFTGVSHKVVTLFRVACKADRVIAVPPLVQMPVMMILPAPSYLVKIHWLAARCRLSCVATGWSTVLYTVYSHPLPGSFFCVRRPRSS